MRSQQYIHEWRASFNEVAHAVNDMIVGLGSAAVPALCQALEDPDCLVGRAAAYAVGEIRDSRAAVPLSHAICYGAGWKESPGYEVGDLPSQAFVLSDLGKESGMALAKVGPSAVSAIRQLFGQLKEKNYILAHYVAGYLRSVRDTASVQQLCDAVCDSREDSYVRSCAADALGEIGDTSALESLRTAASDQDDFLSKAAAQALDKMGSN
jgi:HEAT repeat protein